MPPLVKKHTGDVPEVVFISPLRSPQELKELEFFLISDRSLSVSVSFFADSFHGSVMVLICETERSRSTNCDT